MWQKLIAAAHDEVLAQQQDWEQAGRPANNPNIMQPPLPYEHVMNKVQDVAHRTSQNDRVFPIDVILTLLCRYSVEQEQDEHIGADSTWPVLLFLNLDVPHAAIARVLERILDSQEAPFTGRRRKVVVRWINEILGRWFHVVETLGTSGGIGRWVSDLVDRCLEAMEEVIQLDERAGRPPTPDTQGVLAQTRSMRDWCQNNLGVPGGRLF